MSLNGNFIDTPFSAVVVALRKQNATGTLICVAGRFEKSVYLKSGRIIFAASKDENDRLGEAMVKAGMITRNQLNATLELHQKSRGLKKIGAVMVEHGFVTPKELFNGLKYQVRGILRGLLLLTKGAYRFEETVPGDIIPLQIDIDELMREAGQPVKRDK
jgi:hypothetical protein